MYRVYDIDKKKWLKENVYLSPNDELVLIKRGLFGTIQVPLDADKHIFHKDINLYDKNNNLVFEGDYVKAQVAEDRSVVGLVVFATELSSYIILCVDSDEFYTLGTETCEFIQIIGNVFDGYEK